MKLHLQSQLSNFCFKIIHFSEFLSFTLIKSFEFIKNNALQISFYT